MNKPGEKWTIESMKRLSEYDYQKLMELSEKARTNKFTDTDYYKMRELIDELHHFEMVLIEEIYNLRK